MAKSKMHHHVIRKVMSTSTIHNTQHIFTSALPEVTQVSLFAKEQKAGIQLSVISATSLCTADSVGEVQ
jgi:hypothetical protein